MADFTDFLRADRRLVMLRTLAEMPGYAANSSILAGALDKLGHAATRDAVKADLRWLAEVGLVTIEEAGSVLVATLSDRGQDVAEGKARVDGVAKPRARHGS
ncbi:MAG: ArsR family transcriptional regulator [Betaproteobacteria bacterium]|nr:ArsR family transcriptional regulator [Betaproteobacteria bacterium]MCL2887423.1 ArsR family transcriptional regulator [Betaproteobacteria bacterium]